MSKLQEVIKELAKGYCGYGTCYSPHSIATRMNHIASPVEVLEALRALSKEPYCYLKREFRIYDDNGEDSIISEAEIEEARRTGELYLPRSGELVHNWERVVFECFMSTDRFPNDAKKVALEREKKALFRRIEEIDEEIGKL